MFGFFFHYLFIQNRLFEVVLEEKNNQLFLAIWQGHKDKMVFLSKKDNAEIGNDVSYPRFRDIYRISMY